VSWLSFFALHSLLLAAVEQGQGGAARIDQRGGAWVHELSGDSLLLPVRGVVRGSQSWYLAAAPRVEDAVPSAAAPTSTVALFPVLSRQRLDKMVVTSVQAALEQALSGRPELLLVSGTSLKAKLKRAPLPALIACGSRLACIADLGSAIAAKDVLLTQVISRPGELRVQLLTLDVAGATIRYNATVAAPSVAELPAALKRVLNAAFPQAPPPRPAPTGVEAKPRPPPWMDLPSSAPLAASTETPERPRTPTSSSRALPAVPDLAPAEPPVGEAPPSTASIPAPVVETLPPPRLLPSRFGNPAQALPRTEAGADVPRGGLWRKLAFGLGGAAVVLAGVGGAFALQSQNARSTLKRDGSIGQVTAVRNSDRANTYAARANWAWIAGGALAVLGGISLSIELGGD
jgi:hypothetical protein